MSEDETQAHVNRQLLPLRIRYKDRAVADSRVTSIAFDADRTTVRDAIDIACPKFGITKPEMYGFAYVSSPTSPSGKSPKGRPQQNGGGQTSPNVSSKTASQYGTIRKKTIRDDTEWIPEVKTLAEAGLVSQSEVELKIRHQISAGPHALRIMIPSERKDVVVKYTYNTTVGDLSNAVLQQLVKDKMTFKRNAVDRWKVFLPIISTTEGIWLQDSRTIDSYDLYSGYPDTTTPTMNIPADHLRPIILCRRLEDRDPVILGPSYKNQKEMRWLQRLDEIETMKKKEEKKLIELVRQGLPQTLRGAIWTRIAGTVSNPQTKPLQFLRCLHDQLPPSVVKQIELDVPRTFPSHPFFAEGAQGRQSLYNVLHALAAKYPSIRYCQGQNYLAGICLLNMDEEDSFWLVDWIMQRWNWAGFFNNTMSLTSSPGHQLTILAPLYAPEVHRHLSKLGIPYGVFCSTWFATIFAYDAPLPFVLRVWDIFILEGPSILFRIALAILKTEQDALCQLDWDKILVFLKDISQRLYDVDNILHAALKIKRHRAMDRIYSPEEIHEIAANGGTVPRTLLPSSSSEHLSSNSSSSNSSSDGKSSSEEKPGLFKQFSQTVLPKKTMTSAPSSPNLGNKSPRKDGDVVDSTESSQDRSRGRSRSGGSLSLSVSSPGIRVHIASESSNDSSSGSLDDRTASASLTPNPYHFGTPYFANSKTKKPQQLQIIDSDPSGMPILSLSPKPVAGAAAARPLSSAVSMSAFDLTALEKARANASAISASHHLRFRTTLDTDAASNQQLPPIAIESGSQSARAPSSRRLGIPTLGMPTIAEDSGDDSNASRGSRSAPSSPRKAVSINRDEMSSALADMLSVTADGPSESSGDSFAPSSSSTFDPKRLTMTIDSDNYNDYLSAALSLDNVRTSVPVPFSAAPNPAAEELLSSDDQRSTQSL